MERTGKSYTVKDWFADKVANEVRRNISRCDVFCIIKETEKAVYAMLDLGPMFERCMWVPKSVLVEREADDEMTFDVGEEMREMYWETYKGEYDEALKAYKERWEMFI